MEHKPKENIKQGLRKAQNLSFIDRVEFWSRFFLNKPYFKHPLSDNGGKQSLRFDGFDCMTLVETCLALGMSSEIREVLPNLNNIRYYNSAQDFAHRKHFVSVDWIPGNSSLVKKLDIYTNSICSREIDRVQFFNNQGFNFQGNSNLAKTEKVAFRYLSTDKIKDIASALPRFLIVLFIGGIDWTVVSHMGMLSTKGFMLRHASLSEGKVIEIYLFDYLKTRSSLKGVSFLQILDSA
ncbi:DUF1460 domain-containing protein [bacterium]|nr:DUF1460 domain-containing protein [bacterium]